MGVSLKIAYGVEINLGPPEIPVIGIGSVLHLEGERLNALDKLVLFMNDFNK
jgi:hypothetical protein